MHKRIFSIDEIMYILQDKYIRQNVQLYIDFPHLKDYHSKTDSVISNGKLVGISIELIEPPKK